MRRQAPGLAAFRRNDINIRVAIVLAGEGDPFAVGRKLWVELVADMRGEPPRRAALARGDPQVARVSKNHSGLGNVTVPEKLRLPRRNFLGGLCRRLRRQRRSHRAAARLSHSMAFLPWGMGFIESLLKSGLCLGTPEHLNGRATAEKVSSVPWTGECRVLNPLLQPWYHLTQSSVFATEKRYSPRFCIHL